MFIAVGAGEWEGSAGFIALIAAGFALMDGLPWRATLYPYKGALIEQAFPMGRGSKSESGICLHLKSSWTT